MPDISRMDRTSRVGRARGVDWAHVAGCTLVLAAIGYGIWLRFDGLDRKVVWVDEVATFLHLSGHGETELAALSGSEAHQVGALLDTFQRGDGAIDRVVAFAVLGEPQMGGWYTLARLWSGLGGTEVVAWTRGLSAVASTVALLLLYLVARRLGASATMPALAVALAAVSPLQIRYAQEARAYATWSALVLGAILCLLKARERGGMAAWSAFAVLLAASLWTQPLTVLLLLPFAVLALMPGGDTHAPAKPREGVRSASLVPFVAANGVALLAWLPWVWAIAANRDAASVATVWSGARADPGALARARAWLGVLTSIFFRPAGEGGLLTALASPERVLVLALWLASGLGVLVLVVLALRDLSRNVSEPACGFLLALAAVPFLTLAAADLLLGGRRSTVDRYLLPSWTAIELIVAIYLTAVPRARWRALVAVAVLALGAATGARTRLLPVWWNTDLDALRQLLAVSDRLAGQRDLVIVTDLEPFPLLQLAHRLNGAAELRLGAAAVPGIAADEWPRVALVQPSDELLDVVRRAAGAERRVVRPEEALPIWRVAGAGGG